MKLPSLSYLIGAAKQALFRFPLSILSALVLVLLSIYLIEEGKEVEEVLPVFNLVLCSALGISLFFCASVISEKWGRGFIVRALGMGLAALFLVAVYYSLPQAYTTYLTAQAYIKFAIYAVTAHLLVSFAPYLAEQSFNGFWQYNKALFLRFLAALLYAGFIYVGLIIALTALRLLFDVKIPDKLYAELWVTVAGLFTTWFFVAGIPSDLEALNEKREYPKALRVFSQYVLLPLLAVYLIILYTYGAKIFLTWDWPRGVVSYLIIFISVLGSLSFLLLHPYGEQEEQAWIKKANRVYYYLLFPLLLILFIAIFMRLNDYGITINRYVVLMLGLWLTAVCVYTALGKTNIKFIPASLALMLVLISFGPWGLFSVSEKSQVNRLKLILEQGGILKNGKVQNEGLWEKDSTGNWQIQNPNLNQGSLNDSLHNEVWSIVNYLDDYHGFSALSGWYGQNLDSLVRLRDANKKERFSNLEASMYMQSLGLHYKKIHSNLNESTLHFVAEGQYEITRVSGYDYLLKFERYLYERENTNLVHFEMDALSGDLTYHSLPKPVLRFRSDEDSVDFETGVIYDKLYQKFGERDDLQLPQQEMTFQAVHPNLEWKLELHEIGFEKNPPHHLNTVSGYLLIKRKAALP